MPAQHPATRSRTSVRHGFAAALIVVVMYRIAVQMILRLGHSRLFSALKVASVKSSLQSLC